MKLSGQISSQVLSFSGTGSKISWDASWNRNSVRTMSASRTPNPAVSAMITTNYAVVTLPSALISGSWAKGGVVTPAWGTWRRGSHG